MPKPDDDFYIGYLKTAPEKLARLTRKRVLGFLVMALAIGSGIMLLQFQFYPGVYEFGNPRMFEGVVMEHPYPTLLVERKGNSAGHFPYSRYLLVSQGKFGAEPHVDGLNGQRVKLSGQLIYQDNTSMIEVQPGSTEVIESTEAMPVTSREIGSFTLQGEIVDSKCYLGVMNPGNLKTHKACAIRCISGGIPPVFLVRGEDGAVLYFLLVDRNGGKVNDQVLDRIAEQLEITGDVRMEGGLLVLYSDPETYQRL